MARNVVRVLEGTSRAFVGAKGIYHQESPVDGVGQHRGETQNLFKLRLRAHVDREFLSFILPLAGQITILLHQLRAEAASTDSLCTKARRQKN
jgi:hypothetical protein